MTALADARSAADLSAYYTPSSTAACLASWAIRSGRERVLEPSFGGGALIDAVENQAQMLGQPHLKIVGFDLDDVAVDALRGRSSGSGTGLFWRDFLDVEPEQHGVFDAVVSNPPFTRNHAISAERRAELKRRFGTTGAAEALDALGYLPDLSLRMCPGIPVVGPKPGDFTILDVQVWMRH